MGSQSPQQSVPYSDDDDASIEFHLTVTQPGSFYEMLSSATSVLSDMLPIIVSNGPQFNGVSIRGTDKSKVCVLTAYYACDTAYVNPSALRTQRGNEERLPCGGVQRSIMYNVNGKLFCASMNAMPRQMCMRIVKCADRSEIVCGGYEGTSSMIRETCCIQTLVASMGGGGEGDAADNGAAMDDEVAMAFNTCVIDNSEYMFMLNAENVRGIIGMASKWGTKAVCLSVQEPAAQLCGQRPDQYKHVVLMIHVQGTEGSHSRNFHARTPWADIDAMASAPEATSMAMNLGRPHTDAAARPSNADARTPDPNGFGSSLPSTPCIMRADDFDSRSISTELYQTLQRDEDLCYRCDAKMMFDFMKTVHGCVSIGIGKNSPIVLEHGDDQYRVRMFLAPLIDDS